MLASGSSEYSTSTTEETSTPPRVERPATPLSSELFPRSLESSELFSPSSLDADAAHELIQKMTEILDNRSSAYIERLHAESVHHKAHLELTKAEAEAHKAELHDRDQQVAELRQQVYEHAERAETAELKLSVHERSREDVNAEVQRQIERMSAVHAVELNRPAEDVLEAEITGGDRRSLAEIAHLRLQAQLAEESSDIAERAISGHRDSAAEAHARAEERHAAHAAAARELAEQQAAHAKALEKAAVEHAITKKQAAAHLERVRSEHKLRIEQVALDLQTVSDSRERLLGEVEAHGANLDATWAEHTNNLKTQDEDIAAAREEHRSAIEELQVAHEAQVAEHVAALAAAQAEHAETADNLRLHEQGLAAQGGTWAAATTAHAQELGWWPRCPPTRRSSPHQRRRMSWSWLSSWLRPRQRTMRR